jgi:hypothetical protein
VTVVVTGAIGEPPEVPAAGAAAVAPSAWASTASTGARTAPSAPVPFSSREAMLLALEDRTPSAFGVADLGGGAQDAAGQAERVARNSARL